MPAKARDLTGTRYGRRTVIALAGRRKGRPLWHVRCDCGHESDCLRNTLDKTTRCQFCSHKGPRPSRLKRPYEAAYNALVSRGRHPVLLTYEQFVAFTETAECHYCSEPITWSPHRSRGAGCPSNLDRMDNNGPYVIGNVVVCCLRCNKAKNTHFTYYEWLQLGAVVRSWGRAA